MTKRELLQEYNDLCKSKRVFLDGIYANSNKSEIENAIACLKCSDEVLAQYFTVVSLKYPNTAAAISKSDYRRHSFNRLYVYNTARLVLNN